MTNTLHACTAAPRFATGPATLDLAGLAELVAADGIAAHHDIVVAAVTASGVAERFPVLAELVIDSTAPPIARERALGRLATVAATQVAPPRPGPTVVWEPRAA